MPQYLTIALLHLLESVLRVKRRDWCIPTINDTETDIIRVDTKKGVVAAAGFLTRGCSADTTGAEARTGAVGCRGVVGEAEDGDVERGGVAGGEAALPGKVREGHRLGEGEVVVEVFEGMSIIGPDVDFNAGLEGVCAGSEREEEDESEAGDAHAGLSGNGEGDENLLTRVIACPAEASL